jgi:K+-sensing histidine kinase KdpD
MNKRTALIFYFLSAYVVVQFLWWGFHLIELTSLAGSNSVMISKRTSMIIGEGSIFLLILFVGIWQIRLSIKREMRLAEGQKNFLLSVTHELKTPLAANKLYIQTVTKRDLTKQQANELLNKAIDENSRLERMIDNILNASRIENNALEISKNKYRFIDQVQGVKERFESFSTIQPIQIEVDNDLIINADQFIMESILGNLVENAIKYGGPNVQIVIYGFEKNGTHIFGVKDNGPGISKEHKTAIFNKFFRIGNEDTRLQKGTGLGLFIVAKLVKMHQGTIRCVDCEPNGANFEIKIMI